MEEYVDKQYWENLNKLFAGFCHNLNNPLGAAIGYLELEMMKNSSVKLEKVFNQLVNIENIINITMNRSTCSGENKVERYVDIADIVNMEFNFFSNNLKFKHNLKRQIKIDTKKKFIEIDKCKFRKVIDLVFWEILKKIEDNRSELSVEFIDNIISIIWSFEFLFDKKLFSYIQNILKPDNIEIKVNKNLFQFIIKNA